MRFRRQPLPLPRVSVFYRTLPKLGCLLLVGLPFSSTAQQAPESGQVLHVTSRLVQLDVSVLDKAGNPVRDLQRSDFTISDGGQLQTIRTFEAFSDHTLQLPAGESIGSTADLQRLAPNAPVTVLVLDELNTAFTDSSFARNAIRKYLQAQPAVLPQPTSLLVAEDDGFQQRQDFTQNRERLLAALSSTPPSYPFGLTRTGASREGLAVRFAQTLASLQQVAQATIGHQGRKNIIWVGRGFATLDLRNEGDHQAQLVEGAAERAVDLLQQAHVTVYTIDPTLSTTFATALNVDQTVADPSAFAAETHGAKSPFHDTISFNTIAPETGGRAFSLNNDIDQEISTSIAQGSAFYTISYVPTEAVDTKNAYRQILIHVDRPGLVVVTRRGYFTAHPAPAPTSEKQARKLEGFDLGTAVSSSMTFTGLGVFATESSAHPGNYVVQVSTNDIAWAFLPAKGTTAELTLVAVALDNKGKPVGKAAKEVTASVGREVPLESIPFTTLKISLPITKSADRIRIVVRDNTSGKLGSADLVTEPDRR